MPIQPLLQVEAALIRRQLPDLLLRPGMTLAARVAERAGTRGIIMLAGSPVVAELPDTVSTGDKLKLLVQETRGDKVLMKLIQDEALSAPDQPLLKAALGAKIKVEERGAGGGGGAETASITLTYEGEGIGAVGLRLALAPGAVTVHAEAPAGRPFALAEEASDALRRCVEAATGRSARVTVSPRHDPLDVYA